jgi:hypothetical protein
VAWITELKAAMEEHFNIFGARDKKIQKKKAPEFLKSTQTLRILLRITYFCSNIARKWQMVGWNYYK